MSAFRCAYCCAEFDTEDREYVEIEAPDIYNGYRARLICAACHEHDEMAHFYEWEPAP